eukprot:7382303-Prymnesium_polylepis.1
MALPVGLKKPSSAGAARAKKRRRGAGWAVCAPTTRLTPRCALVGLERASSTLGARGLPCLIIESAASQGAHASLLPAPTTALALPVAQSMHTSLEWLPVNGRTRPGFESLSSHACSPATAAFARVVAVASECAILAARLPKFFLEASQWAEIACRAAVERLCRAGGAVNAVLRHRATHLWVICAVATWRGSPKPGAAGVCQVICYSEVAGVAGEASVEIPIQSASWDVLAQGGAPRQCDTR